MKALGQHILVDLYRCDAELLNDVAYIEEHLKQAAHAAGATIVGSTFHRFSPHGITGVLAIQESHLAIHTWPEYGFAAVDLFTCGEGIDPWRAYESIKTALRAVHGTAVEMRRGQPALIPGDSPQMDGNKDR